MAMGDRAWFAKRRGSLQSLAVTGSEGCSLIFEAQKNVYDVESTEQTGQAVLFFAQPFLELVMLAPLPDILHPARTDSSGLPLARMISLGLCQVFFIFNKFPFLTDLRLWLQPNTFVSPPKGFHAPSD